MGGTRVLVRATWRKKYFSPAIWEGSSETGILHKKHYKYFNWSWWSEKSGSAIGKLTKIGKRESKKCSTQQIWCTQCYTLHTVYTTYSNVRLWYRSYWENNKYIIWFCDLWKHDKKDRILILMVTKITECKITVLYTVQYRLQYIR